MIERDDDDWVVISVSNHRPLGPVQDECNQLFFASSHNKDATSIYDITMSVPISPVGSPVGSPPPMSPISLVNSDDKPFYARDAGSYCVYCGSKQIQGHKDPIYTPATLRQAFDLPVKVRVLKGYVSRTTALCSHC